MEWVETGCCTSGHLHAGGPSVDKQRSFVRDQNGEWWVTVRSLCSEVCWIKPRRSEEGTAGNATNGTASPRCVGCRCRCQSTGISQRRRDNLQVFCGSQEKLRAKSRGRDAMQQHRRCLLRKAPKAAARLSRGASGSGAAAEQRGPVSGGSERVNRSLRCGAARTPTLLGAANPGTRVGSGFVLVGRVNSFPGATRNGRQPLKLW